MLITDKTVWVCHTHRVLRTPWLCLHHVNWTQWLRSYAVSFLFHLFEMNYKSGIGQQYKSWLLIPWFHTHLWNIHMAKMLGKCSGKFFKGFALLITSNICCKFRCSILTCICVHEVDNHSQVNHSIRWQIGYHWPYQDSCHFSSNSSLINCICTKKTAEVLEDERWSHPLSQKNGLNFLQEPRTLPRVTQIMKSANKLPCWIY